MTMIDDAFDAVELDMIRHGDMLGPRLGQKVFDALRNPPSREAGEVPWPGRKFCEVAERNVTELAKWVKGKDDKEVASDAGLALRTLLAHTALPTIKEPTDGK